MLFIVFIYLFIIKQGLATSDDENSSIQLESKLKDLLDLDNDQDDDDDDSNNNSSSDDLDDNLNNEFDQDFAKAALAYIENGETEKSNVVEETGPFQHFNPVGKNEVSEKKAKAKDKNKGQVVNKNDDPDDNNDDDDDDEDGNLFLEKIKDTFYQHKVIISLPLALSILGITFLVSCICTLILRRKLINCFGKCVSSCCRKKKKSSEDLERGKNKKIRSKKTKKAVAIPTTTAVATPSVVSTSWPRAKSLSEDYVDVATQHVSVVEPLLPTRETIIETPPTGCCSKKKRQKKNYRNYRKK